MPYLLRDTYGQEFPVTGVIQIGRDPACQILLSDPQASRLHATLWEDGGRLILRDENSRNGTFVNGQHVRHVTLQPGDQIRIGDTTWVAAAYPAGSQVQTPDRVARGLSRPQIMALVGGGLLLLCVLLVGIGILTYPYFANDLTFLPKMLATPVATSEGTRVVVVATGQTQKMLNPTEYQAATDQLAQAIEALNLAELQFIQDSRASTSSKPGISVASFNLSLTSHSLDVDLCEVAAQAMDAGRTAESLMQTAAEQAEGSQIANTTATQYASIARLSYALVVEAQNLRIGLKSGEITQAKAVTDVAEYNAQLWNPAVTMSGVTGNPFFVYLDNQDNVAPVQFLNDSAVAALMSHAKPGSIRLNWLATTAEEVTKTINFPPAPVNNTNLFDPTLLDTLITAGGQVDANLARQVAALKLTFLVAPNGQNQSTSFPSSLTISVYKGTAMAGKKMIQDMNYPSFPQGKATLEQITTPESLVSTKIELQGDNSPFIGLDEPVKLPEAGIHLHITSVMETNRVRDIDDPKILMIDLGIQVSWDTFGYKNPHFILTCDNKNSVSIAATSGSVNIDSTASLLLPDDTIYVACWAYSPVQQNVRVADVYNTVKINIGAFAASVPTDTPTLTITPTLTQTLTVAPLPTQDIKLETEVAAQKTAEFVATVTEIARQTDQAGLSGIHNLNGTFGMTTKTSGCYPGTQTSGMIKLIIDLAHKSYSGSFTGSGETNNTGIVCNGITFDMACSISYSGTFNGSVDPISGVLSGGSGNSTGTSTCHFTNCSQDGNGIACSPAESGGPISGAVTVNGTFEVTSLTGKGTISTCPGCQGDWSAGQ